MSDVTFTLDLHTASLAVCRLGADHDLPSWAALPAWPLHAVTRTADELSIVTDETHVPDGVTAEPGWRALSVRGPLDFGMTGVLATLSRTLADAAVPVFVVSTFETDWILVPDVHVTMAVEALRADGHEVND